MDLTAHIKKLKDRVHRHGRYVAMAEATGLSASFLQKFATDDCVDYSLRSIRTVEEFLAGKRSPARRSTTLRRRGSQ